MSHANTSKYKLIPELIDNEFSWNVFEKKTEQVIESFYFEDDAKAYMQFLEKGGAFDGFTPSFILILVPEAVNSEQEKLETIFSIQT